MSLTVCAIRFNAFEIIGANANRLLEILTHKKEKNYISTIFLIVNSIVFPHLYCLQLVWLAHIVQ